MANTNYCRYFIQDGGCRNGDNCLFSHDYRHVPICRYWKDTGSCPRKTSCWFPHGNVEEYETKLKERHAAYKTAALSAKGKYGSRRKRSGKKAVKGESSSSARGETATNEAARKMANEKNLKQFVDMLMRRRGRIGSDSEDEEDLYTSGDLVENDVGLWRMKAIEDEININLSPPGSDGSDEEWMMIRYGFDEDEDEDDYWSTTTDDENEDVEGAAAAAKKQPKQKPAKVPCSSGECKHKLMAARRCSNTMCKLCCVMKWPTECEFHGMPGPKEPLDKYFTDESETQPTPDLPTAAAANPGAKAKKGKNASARPVISHSFGKKDNFKVFLENLDLCGKAEEIRFCGNFGIEDEHIVSVARSCPNLTELSLGDTDSGDGSRLTDASIYYLANKCPNLTKLRLVSCTRITDRAIAEVFEKCAGLQEIAVTGHDKSNGHIRGVCLLPLIRDNNKAKQLRKVDFDAQSLELAVVNKFRRERRHVRLSNNEIWGDSMAQMMVRREMYGGGWGSDLDMYDSDLDVYDSFF